MLQRARVVLDLFMTTNYNDVTNLAFHCFNIENFLCDSFRIIDT